MLGSAGTDSLACHWQEAVARGDHRNNIIAVLSQATSYAAARGIRYGVVTTYDTTW